MGNYNSSCFYFAPSKPKTARLLDLNGYLRQVKLPVNAAELMLEEPGFVVSPLHELRRTGRVIALRAEDVLLAGEIYLFVALSRLNRRISESEMEVVESAAAASVRMRRRRAKVLPAVPVAAEESEIEGSEMEDVGSGGCRMGNNNRHWTPVLETISEEA